MILTLVLSLQFSSVKDTEVCQVSLCWFIIDLNIISRLSELNQFIFHLKQRATF